MEIFVLVSLVLFVIVAIMLLKLIKHTFVAVLSVIGIFLILNAAIGFLVYQDVMEIKDKSLTTPDLFLLVDSGEIIAGVTLNPSIKPIENAVRPLDAEQLIYLNDNYFSNDKEIILSEFKEQSDIVDEQIFKIIEFDFATLENAPYENLDVQMFTLKKQDMLKLLKSEDVFQDMVDVILEDETFMNQLDSFFPSEEFDLESIEENNIDIDSIKKDILKEQLKENLAEFAKTDEDAKGLIFMLGIGAIIQEDRTESVKYIYGNYKDGNIIIYPESITFSILKLSPKSLVEQIITQVNTQLNSEN